MTGKELLRLLRKHGWVVVRIRGSHHIMANPSAPDVRLSVPVHPGEMPTGTASAILKRAGLK